MKKYLVILIFCLVLPMHLLAQTGQSCTMGIGAVSDSATVMVTIGQPFYDNNFGFASLVDNSEDTLLCYNIGDIPDITVNPDIKTRFKLTWNDHENANYSYSLVFYPYDAPEISFNPTKNGVVFEYNPSADIYRAFQLAFKAIKLNDTVEQTVTFNPATILPQEYKLMAYRYDSTMLDTIVVSQTENHDTVYIIGKTVLFENGKINHSAYSYNEGTSCKKFSIYATNLIVRDSVCLPGSDLTIYCEHLSFETDNACFNIQPRQAVGADGEDTKNMHVYSRDFTSQSLAYRFWLRGGKGGNEKNGGDAGNFTSNLNLKKYVNLEGGYVGDQPDGALVRSKGSNGQYISEASYFRWLHPIVVRFALERTTDDYIYGLYEKVFNTCEKYTGLLDAYKKSSEYDTSAQHSLDLVQLYQSFTVLYEKLSGGYDYFGNPRSWAPLLSFESNLDMYENEIEYAIRVLYLHYWITGINPDMESKKEGAENLIAQNLERITALRETYIDATGDYPAQKAKYQSDCNLLYEIDNKLNIKIDSLLAIAKRSVASKNKWKGFLYDIGVACSYHPLLSPYGFMFKTAAKMDYTDPFCSDNLKAAEESVSDYLDDLTSKVQVVGGYYSKNPQLMIDGGTKLLNNALEELSPGALKESLSSNNQLVMPSDEVEAKFNQLKAGCPQIDELTDSLEIVSQSKAKSWENLSYSLNIINNTSGEINQLLTAISALNNFVNDNTNVDPRAISVLNEMKKNAWSSLLKYHYYLALAYQYRFLKPYAEDINMKDLFTKIEEIALNDSADLKPDDYQALKVIFESPLKEITDELYDNFNSGVFIGSNEKISYTLSDEELSMLNTKGEVSINLWESGKLDKNFADIRITDFTISDDMVSVWSDTVLSDATLKILLEHSGKSMFVDPETGLHYMFDQFNSKAKTDFSATSLSQIGWGFIYNFSDQEVSPVSRSLQDNSLIKYILNKGSNNDIFIFTQPSAWADIKIKRKLNTGEQTSMNFKLNDLKLVFNIDYRSLNSNYSNVLVKTNNGLTPLIECSKTDVNGLNHGQGNFTRTFNSTDFVEFTAPMTYGNYVFNRWARTSASSVTDFVYSNNIQINAQLYHWITAQYKLAVPQLNVPDTIWVGYTAQTVQIDIKNDNYCDDIPMDWSITENCSWLSIAVGSSEGTENGTVTLQLSENEGGERTGKIKVCTPEAINPLVDIVVVQLSRFSVNAKEVFTDENITLKLQPNPVSNQVNVIVEGINSGQMVQYSIIDMQGKQILSGKQSLNAAYPEFDIDIENVNDGMYLLVLTTANKELIREKLLVQK